MFKPEIKIIWYNNIFPRIIASAGKSSISPKNMNSIIEEMDRVLTSKWLKELIRRGHGSPLEHSLYIFEIICSRVTSHQIVRHRIASYTQLSQRYSDKYLRNLIKIISDKQGITRITGKPLSRTDYRLYAETIYEYLESINDFDELLSIASQAFIIPPHVIASKNNEFLKELIKSIADYYMALAYNISPEDARYLLPQAIKTRILVSMNARELLESFLPLRMCSHAQWEIRYIAWELWRKLKKIHPEIFAFTGPRCILMDNRVRDNLCELEDYVNGYCKPVITRCPELVKRENIVNCLIQASSDPWFLLKEYP